ncbi:hypothetical protein [Peribacillus deserti]|uniref:Sialidase domain-containing protein n=1 Tax=Peribacillus deserti TaxID=673318 RepID=A0A2N5MBS5_9BACI|nr:hypothetical protein [Peribacillus deserti]PLT31801.1 hypothetical protein CUU66_01190 [Peribacillus deserti]
MADLIAKGLANKVNSQLAKITPQVEMLGRGRRAGEEELNAQSYTRHSPVLLDIKTSDGTGQATHPDVIFIESGFGSAKWRYWMVMSPYKDNNNQLGNPEVLASHDGLIWEVPSGLTNPITPAVGSPSYYSDAVLVHYNNQLYLFYRLSDLKSTPNHDEIHLKTSLDGVTWTKPQL